LPPAKHGSIRSGNKFVQTFDSGVPKQDVGPAVPAKFSAVENQFGK
jgi:hypothetical protein